MTASVSPTPNVLRHNVPGALSSFVGRSEELRALRARLGESRLVTVVGPGGAGKTRLAREFISGDLGGALFDVVWWVDLAPVREANEVAAALATTLGVGGAPGRELTDAICAAVELHDTLLVFDNCEHVIDEVARVVSDLLRLTRRLRVLATSREPLAVDGEFAWSIPALAVPTGTTPRVGEADAVRLFVDRVRSVTPHFSLTDDNAQAVVTLCQRLDGMPLSLELAAAVVPALGVDTLVTRFDDALTLLTRGKRSADPRHRTLRAVLDWSYDLLTPDEQRLLRRLSVFRGAFQLDAVEAVCADGTGARDRAAAVAALGRLVEQSLVEVRDDGRQSRYRLLETVRQYGAALLRDTADEALVRERHARYFTQFAERREALFFSPERGRMVREMRAMLDEIRAALEWGMGDGGDAALAVKLGGVLGWFWISGIPWSDARALVQRIVAAHDAEGVADDALPLARRLDLMRLLYPVIGLAYFAGDVPTMLAATARERALRGVLDPLTLDDDERLTYLRQAALSEQLRGIAFAMLGDADASVPCMDRSIALADQAGDAWLSPVMRIRRALVHYYVTDLASAQADYAQAIPELRRIGEHWFLSLALEGMANVLVTRGHCSAALPYALEAATVLDQERDEWFISRACDTTAWVVACADESAAVPDAVAQLAVQLVGAAEALRRACGAGIIGPDVARDGQLRERLRTRIGGQQFERAVAEGMKLSLDDVLRRLRAPLLTLPTSERNDEEPATAPGRAPGVRGARDSATAPTLEVRLLGPFALRHDGVSVPDAQLPAGKVRELLTFLVLNDVVSKEQIGLALWPEASAAQLRNVFHVTLHHLRRHLGEHGWISFERGRYRLLRTLGTDTRCDVDVDRLEQVWTDIREAVKRRTPVSAEQLDAWQDVLTTYGAELLPDVVGEAWLTDAQDRMRTRWSDAVEGLLVLARNASRHEQVLTLCELLVRRDPYRESAHRAYMEALGAMGERARALAHFESLVVMLERELGAKPSAETRRLVESLRR